MQLTNTFTVPVPVDRAWDALLDVERVAPCLPGASVESMDGDDVLGNVKVKLGPISLAYRGTVTFVERDASRHRAVLAARAQESRGGGTAQATVTAELESNGSSTDVTVRTDLMVTGKPAQFGRGVMEDVSSRLLGQFADNLAWQLEATPAEPGAVPLTSAGQVAPAPEPAAELDVLSLILPLVRKRLPAIAAGAAVLAVLCLLGRRALR